MLTLIKSKLWHNEHPNIGQSKFKPILYDYPELGSRFSEQYG